MPFEETVWRHATRPQAAEFTTKQMADWWEIDDRLGIDHEIVVASRSTVDETIALLQ